MATAQRKTYLGSQPRAPTWTLIEGLSILMPFSSAASISRYFTVAFLVRKGHSLALPPVLRQWHEDSHVNRVVSVRKGGLQA